MASRRVREAKAVSPGIESIPALLGRARKKHPLDCGNPRCQLCHRDKLFGERRFADERRDSSAIE